MSCHFLFQGNLPNPGIEAMSPALAGGFFTTEPPGMPTMEYYSPTENNERGSVAEMWMDLESVIQSEVGQKEKNKYHI